MGLTPSTPLQRCENDLKLAQETGNKQQEAQAYLELGNLHKLNRQFQASYALDAMKYFGKALKIAKERKDDEQVKQVAQAYFELGNRLKLDRQLDMTTERFDPRRALKIAKELKLDEKVVKQAAQASFELEILFKMSIHYNMTNYMAIECYQEALKIAKERKEDEQVNRAYIELAKAYLSANASQTGFEYFWKALEIDAVIEYNKKASQFQKEEGDRIEKLSTAGTIEGFSTIFGELILIR